MKNILKYAVFLRHGETIYNKEKLTTGWKDPCLTASGWKQAFDVAEILNDFCPSEIVVSPLLRCRETALPIISMASCPVRIEEGFRERGWGRLEGLSKVYRDGLTSTVGLDVEPAEKFESRVRASFYGLSGSPIVVAHSGVFRFLASWLRLRQPARIMNGEAVVLERHTFDVWNASLLRSPFRGSIDGMT